MQAADWISLLKRIPEDEHETLMLVMNTGVEVAIQTVLRYDETCLVIRGRLGGTADDGRAFIVPYEFISFLYFNRKMTRDKLIAVFGEILGKFQQTAIAEVDIEDVETTEVESPEVSHPQIDVAALQAGGPRPSMGPRSIAGDLRSRLLKSKQAGQPPHRPGS